MPGGAAPIVFAAPVDPRSDVEGQLGVSSDVLRAGDGAPRIAAIAEADVNLRARLGDPSDEGLGGCLFGDREMIGMRLAPRMGLGDLEGLLSGSGQAKPPDGPRSSEAGGRSGPARPSCVSPPGIEDRPEADRDGAGAVRAQICAIDGRIARSCTELASNG